MLFVKFYWLEDFEHNMKTGNPVIMMNEPAHYKNKKPGFLLALENLASVSR
jgi:hypothetical protein